MYKLEEIAYSVVNCPIEKRTRFKESGDKRSCLTLGRGLFWGISICGGFLKGMPGRCLVDGAKSRRSGDAGDGGSDAKGSVRWSVNALVW